MLSLRILTIVITGAGVFAGLPLPDARACDDDRYPCPVRAEVLTQETAEMPIESAPSAQPQKKSAQQQKKAKHPAGPNEKAHAKRERDAPQATAKASKPAVQEKTTDSVSQKAPEANPEVVPSPRAEEPPNDERPVTSAGTAWPVLPSTEGVGVPVATGGEPTEAANTNAVQLVDPNEVNDLDRAAAATVSTESSWSIYLLLILGAALAAAAAVWFFTKLTAVYARRAAGLRMHMRSDW
jgi:outer membrane biosynthesis protein TonB